MQSDRHPMSASKGAPPAAARLCAPRRRSARPPEATIAGSRVRSGQGHSSPAPRPHADPSDPKTPTGQTTTGHAPRRRCMANAASPRTASSITPRLEGHGQFGLARSVAASSAPPGAPPAGRPQRPDWPCTTPQGCPTNAASMASAAPTANSAPRTASSVTPRLEVHGQFGPLASSAPLGQLGRLHGQVGHAPPGGAWPVRPGAWRCMASSVPGGAWPGRSRPARPHPALRPQADTNRPGTNRPCTPPQVHGQLGPWPARPIRRDDHLARYAG